MKYLAGIFLLLIMQTANATLCKIDNGLWFSVQNGSMPIRVKVKATPGTGVIVLDGYTMMCKYAHGASPPDRYIDYWFTNADPLVPGGKFASYKMGMRIDGMLYPTPPSYHRIATLPNTVEGRAGVDLKTYVYIDTKNQPGDPIDIRAGDILADLNFRQTNNWGGGSLNFKLILQADNDLFFEPSTCTINGNNPIDVDFEEIDPLTISDSPLSSTVEKKVTLNYSCPDPGITQPITITLRGANASFNADAIAMSHADLGTALIRGGAVVGPGKSFRTQLTNSVGSDEVTFSLIRKAGSYPEAGVYTGSATLVMGFP